MIKHENLKRFRENQKSLESVGYKPIFTSKDGGVAYLLNQPKNTFSINLKFLHNDSTMDDWDTDWKNVFEELLEAKPAIMDLLLNGADND